jgi:3-dehydroquinate synthase
MIERGILERVGELLDLGRRVLVLTDREVPKEYVDSVCLKCLYPVRVSVWPGKDTNSLDNYQKICEIMAENSFCERDCVVSIGGERVLSLGCFVAATYECGIDHYCIPTTFAAQIGNGFFGRKYVSLGQHNKVMGTVCLPTRVLVDAELLSTLDQREMANGFAEVIRLALVLDKKLFAYLEKEDPEKDKVIDRVVSRAIEIKNYVFRKQGSEPELAEALMLGAIIADSMEKTQFSYGERLAIAMIPMCTGEARIRLRDLLAKVGLPVVWQYDFERLFRDSVRGNDAEKIPLVICDEVGSYRMDKLTVPEYHKLIKTAYGG